MSEKLIDLAIQIVAAEENARLIAESIKDKVQVEVTPTPSLPITSRVIRDTNVKIPDTLIDLDGSGCIKEFVIKSSSVNYILKVYVDNLELYHNTYTWFENISQQVEEIDAFEDNGIYVLRLSNINFANGIKIAAEPIITALEQQPITSKLDEIFCKYDITVKSL